VLKAPGLQAAKLIARNEKLKLQLIFYQAKVIKLRGLVGDNEIKIRELLTKEKLDKKFKID
jgi:hypothetical protein